MTKDETIDMIIDDYKNGSQSAMRDYCNGTRCDDCQFDFNDCMNDVTKTLTERLLKAEEKKETNLEHYASKSPSKEHNASPFMSYETDTLSIALKYGWEKTFNWSDPIQWLLSPYEEPKPKYKLTQFEYDLLSSYCELSDSITETWTLYKMQSKGYFEGIPTSVPIQDILDNCEVVD